VLPWPLRQRIAALALAVFAISKINTVLELFFFSTHSIQLLVGHLLVGMFSVLLMCFLVCYSFPPPFVASTVKADLAAMFSRRRALSWVLRLFLAILTYVITYFVFGAIAFKYTYPYYTDPAYGLNLKLPEPGVVLKLQFFRSFIYLAVCLPLIAGLPLRKLQIAIYIGLLLFVSGGLTPLLSTHEWPMALRFYHTVEILFQNFTTGALFAYLLHVSVAKSEFDPVRTGEADYVPRSF
jgi:hypothetical protein